MKSYIFSSVFLLLILLCPRLCPAFTGNPRDSMFAAIATQSDPFVRLSAIFQSRIFPGFNDPRLMPAVTISLDTLHFWMNSSIQHPNMPEKVYGRTGNYELGNALSGNLWNSDAGRQLVHGRRQQSLGYYSEALKIYREAARLARLSQNDSILAYAYIGEGEVLGTEHNPLQVKVLYEKALYLFKKHNNQPGIAEATSSLAYVRFYNYEYDAVENARMINNITEAYDACERIKYRLPDMQVLPRLMRALSYTYWKPKNFSKAVSAARRGLEAAASIPGSVESKLTLYSLLVEIYGDAGMYSKAIIYGDSMLQQIALDHSPKRLMEGIGVLPDLYAHAGQFERAFILKGLVGRIIALMLNRDRSRQINEMHTRQTEAENNLLNREVELKTNREYALIASSLILLAGVYLSITVYRARLKASAAERSMLAQRLTNEQLEREKADITAAAAKSEQERISAELAYKTNELSSITAYMLQKNAVITGIRSGLGQLDNTNRNLQKVAEQLDNFMTDDSDWDSFREHFERVNTGFIDRLLAAGPDLTAKEVKMCSYIRMNLDINQISQLLNIRDSSVRNFRVRLRKKLNLTDEQELTAYILNL
ncbi:MAG: hypothetical protein V4543_16565 [Bacteroidota bacterium]